MERERKKKKEKKKEKKEKVSFRKTPALKKICIFNSYVVKTFNLSNLFIAMINQMI